MSAPKRIYAALPECPYYWAKGEVDVCYPHYERDTAEYIRADLATSEADALRAEIARLRDVLEKCAQPHTWYVPCISCGQSIKEQGNYIARAALKGGDV